MKGNGAFPASYISEGDLDQLWTTDDRKSQQKLEENQQQNRQKLTTLRVKLQEVITICEGQLQQTLKSLREETTGESQ